MEFKGGYASCKSTEEMDITAWPGKKICIQKPKEIIMKVCSFLVAINAIHVFGGDKVV